MPRGRPSAVDAAMGRSLSNTRTSVHAVFLQKEAVMAIDQRKLQALLGRAVADIGANLHTALVVTGDKLGLFRALHELGPTTPADLAEHTGTHEPYAREWPSAIAPSRDLTHDGARQ